MGRASRYFLDEKFSSYHMISRTTGNGYLIGDKDKEYFVNLMFKLGRAYYVDIKSYVVMSNHFHILLSSRIDEVLGASEKELVNRYKSGFGGNAQYPEGGYLGDSYEIDYDEDGGIERLRRRLGSASRFMQDLKQRFTKWYNNEHNRKGVLWGNRFKGVAISKGDAELICSAYIDLNSIRAGLVEKPEDYRWSSIGLKVRKSSKAAKLLKEIKIEERKDTYDLNYKVKPEDIVDVTLIGDEQMAVITFPLYRAFVYNLGNLEKDGTARISDEVYHKSRGLCFQFNLGDSLRYRFRNITEGIGFGTEKFIGQLQEQLGRKFIKPREVTDSKNGIKLFSTRKLKSI